MLASRAYFFLSVPLLPYSWLRNSLHRCVLSKCSHNGQFVGGLGVYGPEREGESKPMKNTYP